MDEEISQPVTLNPEEKQEFEEFKRQKRIAEAKAVIRKTELNLTKAQDERSALRRAVKDSEKLGLGGICVTPYLVKPCSEFLGVNSSLKVVACISPNGTDVTDIKVKQLKRAIKDGAGIAEITACIPAIKEGSWGYVKRELKKLRKAAKKIVLRINAEAPLLTSQELSKLSSLACECDIPCIKTASDLYGSGASEEDLKIIKSAVKDRAIVKADGADSAAAIATLIGLGADIIGSPAALTIALNLLSVAER